MSLLCCTAATKILCLSYSKAKMCLRRVFFGGQTKQLHFAVCIAGALGALCILCFWAMFRLDGSGRLARGFPPFDSHRAQRLLMFVLTLTACCTLPMYIRYKRSCEELVFPHMPAILDV